MDVSITYQQNDIQSLLSNTPFRVEESSTECIDHRLRSKDFHESRNDIYSRESDQLGKSIEKLLIFLPGLEFVLQPML